MAHLLYLLSMWLHILAAAAWIGGMLFLVLVIVPLLRRPELRAQAAQLVRQTGRRFRTVGWAALWILLLTGTFNLLYRGIGLEALARLEFWQGPFGRALAIKLALVAVVLLLSGVHDFFVGPRATEAWQSDPGSARALRLRRSASWMGRLNLLLALVIVAMAVILVRGWP